MILHLIVNYQGYNILIYTCYNNDVYGIVIICKSVQLMHAFTVRIYLKIILYSKYCMHH
jgi:hypothetical protein